MLHARLKHPIRGWHRRLSSASPRVFVSNNKNSRGILAHRLAQRFEGGVDHYQSPQLRLYGHGIFDSHASEDQEVRRMNYRWADLMARTFDLARKGPLDIAVSSLLTIYKRLSMFV